ncbi:MAG: hypothetical protein IT329_06905 [Caldilineaceae bacterium]|nr:hypothetical protein [Caldilineaceae bacterium]
MATKRTLPQSTLQQMRAALFDDSPHTLAQPFEDWLTSSKSFALFVQTYQQKIRKKIRMSRDDEELYNLYCELRTAYLLVQEPKFAVAYEPYTKQQGRSPDFSVTYRTHTTFHVEVTRLHAPDQGLPPGTQGAGPENDETIDEANRGLNQGPEESTAWRGRDASRRLADVVCDKVRQLSPSTPNVLWMWVQSQAMDEIDLAQQLPALKRRAEQRDAALLARHGFRNPADFIRHYQRLSLILAQSPQTQAEAGSPLVWINNDARYPLPAPVRHILCTIITTDSSQDYGGAGNRKEI